MNRITAYQTALFEKYVTLLVVAMMFLTYSDLPAYIYYSTGFEAVYFYYVYFLLIAPLLILRFDTLMRYMASPYALWAIGYVCLNLFHLALVQSNSNALQGQTITTRIQFVGLSILMGFACTLVRTVTYSRVFAVLGLLLPSLTTFDFFEQGVFYEPGEGDSVVGRAAGLYLSPTHAGEGILLALLLALPGASIAFRPIFILLAGVGTILTFSRSSILVWVMVWLILQARRALPHYMVGVFVTLVVVLPILSTLVQNYIGTRSDFAGTNGENITERIQFFESKSLADDSALERAEVAKAGIELFQQHAIFGAGGAFTSVWDRRVGPHNELILLAAEYGIFGLLAWAWLGVVIYRGQFLGDRSLHFCAAAAYVASSFFSHNMFDNFYWLQFAALVAGKRTE